MHQPFSAGVRVRIISVVKKNNNDTSGASPTTGCASWRPALRCPGVWKAPCQDALWVGPKQSAAICSSVCLVAASAVNPAPPVSVRRAPWSRAQVRKDREAGGSPLGRPASRRVVPHLACPSRTSRQSSVIRLHVPSLPCRGCSGPILQRGRRAPEGSLTDSCSESVFSHWPHPSVCPPRPQPCSHCWGSSGGGAVVT